MLWVVASSIRDRIIAAYSALVKLATNYARIETRKQTHQLVHQVVHASVIQVILHKLSKIAKTEAQHPKTERAWTKENMIMVDELVLSQ